MTSSKKTPAAYHRNVTHRDKGDGYPTFTINAEPNWRDRSVLSTFAPDLVATVRLDMECTPTPREFYLLDRAATRYGKNEYDILKDDLLVDRAANLTMQSLRPGSAQALQHAARYAAWKKLTWDEQLQKPERKNRTAQREQEQSR